jgi:hypothetical protein
MSSKGDVVAIVQRLDQLVVTDFFDIHPDLRAEFVDWIDTLNQIASPGHKPPEHPKPPIASPDLGSGLRPPSKLEPPPRSAPKPAAKAAPRVKVKAAPRARVRTSLYKKR